MALCDIAGRDSAAAATKAFEQGSVTHVLPISSNIPTCYGPWAPVHEHYVHLKKWVETEYDGVALDYSVVGDVEFWRFLNARYVSALVRKLGFYSPCPGCHLYIHTMTAVIARALGIEAVISGERVSHDGKVKINQVPAALSAYQEVMGRFGIQHILPVRDIADSSQIERIVGGGWNQNQGGRKCVFSGSYFLVNGECAVTEAQLQAYYEEFAIPLALKIVELRIDGKREDFQRRVETFAKSLLS